MAGEPGEGSDDTAVPWRSADDRALLSGMREGFHAAFAECYRRFAPMLARMAERRGVPEEDRETLVADHLEDTLIPILRRTQRDPSPFGAYLAAGFRRRLVSVWRAREREHARRRRLETVSSGLLADDRHRHGADQERVVAEGLSEYALQSARRPEITAGMAMGGRDPAREAREGLARALAQRMTAEELQIMGQVAERYPQREIAAAFGVGPSGMRMRILRLRERLAIEAVHYIGALPHEDGIRLARFLGTPRAHRVPAERLPARDPAGHRHQGDEHV